MSAYVARINRATLDVSIAAVRVGGARYSRLAQINLETRIITFSRYAVENVPERGRRYLVIHELAHVLEPAHNRRFWEIISRFEPEYKRIDKELEAAFRANVRAAELAERGQPWRLLQQERRQVTESVECYGSDIVEDQSGAWIDIDHGVICGGSW